MGALLSKRMAFWLVAIAVVLVAAGVSARRLRSLRKAVARPPTTARGSENVLLVPHAPGSVILDGDTDDPGWTGTPPPARTHDFLAANGAPARPFSEIRFVWGDGYLYLSLYAADEDIESRTTEPDGPLWLDDSFRVVFAEGDTEQTEYAIEVSPRAIMTDSIRHRGGKWDFSWSSGAHASTEMDGTLNDPKNKDEEWVIELAVPFDAIGLEGRSGETIGFSASRCDTPRGTSRVCSTWGQDDPRGRLVLQ